MFYTLYFLNRSKLALVYLILTTLGSTQYATRGTSSLAGRKNLLIYRYGLYFGFLQLVLGGLHPFG